MTEKTQAKTALVRYVYTDIVAFTKGRSVEAQSDLVAYLNQLILSGLETVAVAPEQRLLLPTGDGVCIALISSDLAYDIHLSLALAVLSKLEQHNNSTGDQMRRFQLRVGLNQNVDNLVTDINGHPNVAGSGINLAERVMSFCDPNQILVGQTVYDVLHVREAYLRAFRSYSTVIKHRLQLPVFQFVRDAPGLNSNVPSAFVPKDKKRPTLTSFAAYYIALSVKHQQFLLSRRHDVRFAYNTVCWLYFQAYDLSARSSATKFDTLHPQLWGYPTSSVLEQYQYYDRQDFWTIAELSERIESTELGDFQECFESFKYVFVSETGLKRLKDERPDIAREILGESSGISAIG